MVSLPLRLTRRVASQMSQTRGREDAPRFVQSRVIIPSLQRPPSISTLSMAPSRPLFEPDSGEDTEVDTPDPTPAPRRSGLKKRLSEGHILNKSLNDTTHDDEGNPRRPAINDDAAEKRRRRKSTRIAVIEEPVAGPSTDGNQSIGDMSRSKQRKQIHSVQPITLPNIPEGARTAQFEELLKLTTDNVRRCLHYCLIVLANLQLRKSIKAIPGILL